MKPRIRSYTGKRRACHSGGNIHQWHKNYAELREDERGQA